MNTESKRLMIVLACMLLMVVSCGDGGSSSPTSVSTPINVSGVWSFVGQLIQNTCDLDAVSPISGSIAITQTGSVVETGRVDLSVTRDESLFFFYAGMVTGNNVSMAARDPYVFQGGGNVIQFGSGLEIQNISNNSASGSFNLTGLCVQGCTGSCQTIWSGTWTR